MWVVAAVLVACLAMVVTVAVLWRVAQDRDENERLVDDYETCVQTAQRGAEISDTALEGVRHAESTAALMDSIVDILEGAFRPDHPAVVAIRAEVNEYVDGVAEYRRIAESYKPIPMSECEALPGAALAD